MVSFYCSGGCEKDRRLRDTREEISIKNTRVSIQESEDQMTAFVSLFQGCEMDRRLKVLYREEIPITKIRESVFRGVRIR